jgi:ABC-type uncharacterized transport system involved in gliding motility auxiliary subunit
MARKKKSAAQKYAFIPLIVAGVGLLATALFGLFRGLIALELYTPLNPDDWTRVALQASALVTLGALAVYGIMAPDTVRRFLSGRQARYGSNALVMALAFVGILVVVNIFAAQNTGERIDMTEDKAHTLAPETLQALATLPENVTAIAFFTTPSIGAEELLQDFKANSNGKFDYQFVNPDTDPIAARQAGITGDGKIMLRMGEQTEIASFASESELTLTLIRLISPGTRAVYFLTGHGEPDITAGGEVSLSVARSTLESKNYTVDSLNLLVNNKIPEDALAVIIAGPQKPLSPTEMTTLRNYVDQGGALVVMEDPVEFTEFGDASDPLASYLSTAWGITLNNDVIIDLTSQNPLQAVSFSANPHAITQNMTYVVILPQARSLAITGQPANVIQTSLITTSDQSWGESDYANAEGGQVTFDEGQDTLGPLNLAVAAENMETQGRVVVFGNSFFATDEVFDAYGNGNIFINSVDWSAQEEDLIQITPRQPIERSFQQPESPIAWIAIWLGSICVLPGLVLVAGIAAWIARRRQG